MPAGAGPMTAGCGVPGLAVFGAANRFQGMSDVNAQSASARRWHALQATEALAAVGSDPTTGLSAAEAARRLAKFGPNALPEAKRRSLAGIFLGQFRSPLIYLLFGAAGLALAFGHRTDAAVIFVVVLLNAVIGAFQEGRAERSLAALRRLADHEARLVRDGRELVVAARAVVPGDVLILQAGDAVAADARLLEGAALQIAEAALTGESQPASKSPSALDEDTPLADRRNMVFAGTHVAAGRARAVVVATGLATEIGHISALTGDTRPLPTPLERRVQAFGRVIIYVAGVLFGVIVVVGWAHHLPLSEIVVVAVSQVVGMVPEGLPVAMTIALAVGVQRMAARQAVVRRLSAVETLGSTTVICTDKTGTLTRNEMTVTELVLADGTAIRVTGAGYAPEGRLVRDGPLPDDPVGLVTGLDALLRAVTLCNDAQLLGPVEAPPNWRPLGDPTEVALLTLAVKAGLVPADVRTAAPRRAELPFDPSLQMMATQHETSTGGLPGTLVVLKGAPEALLPLCDPASTGVAASHAAAERLAAKALRVLAVAVVEGGVIDGARGFEAFRGRARLLGLVGEIDPPRLEVADAVARCRAAGIRTVMVTGDHKTTAVAIARQLGIVSDQPGMGDEAVDGRELERMSDDALAARIERIAVFARVHPAQKLRIIAAWQKRGDVVAMTGDGVNDAPALVRADVGVAMGRSGTEVAKEAAEIVIGDDNFASIVAAVEEGRVVYRNLAKTVLLLCSTAVAAVVVLLVALVAGGLPPLAAVQILWINLVTEGLVTVNLVLEPAEGDEMQRPPIPAGDRLVTRALLTRMAFMVPAMVASIVGWYFVRSAAGVPAAQVQTETFTLLAICCWYNVLNCRSERGTAFDRRVFENRWLLGGLLLGNALQVIVVFWTPMNAVFHTVPLSPDVVFALAAVGSLVLWVEELRKASQRFHWPATTALPTMPR